jgi:hypothetical protein
MSHYGGKFLLFAVVAPGEFPDKYVVALTKQNKLIDLLPIVFLL